MTKKGLIIILLFSHLQLIAQVNFTQSNLPIFVINTNGVTIPDVDKITGNMKIIYNGVGQINRLTDQTFHFNGIVGIETRGSTSQQLSEKKPYSVEVRNALGKDTAVSLLGMPKEADWALIAPYSDKTLMRDALVYQLARSLMAWAPRTRFCEVVVNGSYMGVYVLTEKLKRDKNRVNITKSDSTTLTGDALTGGYILKIDKSTGNLPGFTAGFYSAYSNSATDPNKKTFFQFEHPNLEDIKPGQKNYIQTAVGDMERAMALPASSFSDPSVGYPKYWDTQTLVDFFIINEIARNVDGYRLSTYFYKDKNSIDPRFKMGPVWDFNIALGNADYCRGASISGWAMNFNQDCPADSWGVSFWWPKLMADFNFKKQLKARWTKLRANELSNQRIGNMIDSMAFVLDEAQGRNFQKWNILGKYVWPNPFIGTTYSREITYMREWTNSRIAWIDGQMDLFPTGRFELVEKAIVYPNPSVTGFTFEYILKKPQEVKLLIRNDLGQLVFEKTAQQNAGNQQLFWRDARAAQGLYFYELQVDNVRRMMGKVVLN